MNKLAATMEPEDEDDAMHPERQNSELDDAQTRTVRQIANHLHRLNHAVMAAVETGISVEIVRSARHHGGKGNWGDLMLPVIVKR